MRAQTRPGDAERETVGSSKIIKTDIPARLDRLPWTGFHTRIILALGITWILDGLEVTIAGSVSGALRASPVLHLSESEIGLSASAYLIGAVAGALFFGWLTDRLGRRKLFYLTLGLYLVATISSACAWNFWSFALLRGLTGAGIGGEYAAMNSAIQEFIPARFRGRTDLVVNGSFWLGAGAGAAGSAWLLASGLVSEDLGWRLAFGIGAVLGLGILILRQWIPESPRWLMIRGRIAEADAILDGIEAQAGVKRGEALRSISLRIRDHAVGPIDLARSLVRLHPRMAFLGLVLMATQAFFYNAIFFTYPLVLDRFYQVPAHQIGLYILPFALGNFLGSVLLAPLFDLVGRRPMIAATYSISGLLLAVLAVLFVRGDLDAVSQTIGWSTIFFFASAAASAAYLTVSESFPLEIRALAIAVFYAVGTAVGGVIGPALFSHLIEGGERGPIGWGYGLAAAMMVFAALVELKLGIAAEGKSLEDVARPLSASD
ncbi:MAG TPA: MFS transporter [Aliidongia sp.]|nr:MFS transporter [Aliidongia sp.]